MWMKAFQLLCAFCGSYGAYLVDAKNGIIIAGSGVILAYVATLAVVRLRDAWSKQPDSSADW